MIEIIPAIMPKSEADLEDKVGLVAGRVSTVQLDIMDGRFVPSRTWPHYSSDRASFEALLSEEEGLPYWDQVDFEIDLMVDKPEEAVEDWVVAGASRIVAHIESTKHMNAVADICRGRVELGIALNIDTPTDAIDPYLEDAKFVQFMGIRTIGLQGEPFDDRVVDKIRAFHNNHPEIVIAVDGGVSLENAKLLVEAGAKRLVSGSGIFASGNPAEAVKQFRDLL